MPDKKSLRNLTGRIVAICDGAEWNYKEQEKHCDHAAEATHAHRCMFLCDHKRCDSHEAQDFAVKKK